MQSTGENRAARDIVASMGEKYCLRIFRRWRLVYRNPIAGTHWTRLPAIIIQNNLHCLIYILGMPYPFIGIPYRK